ncbi:MAG: hypothetical protein IBJ11_10105 [Phycisphaerales bacterium]|nr:hypothetical protein [Phycisphaerales bacterium]
MGVTVHFRGRAKSAEDAAAVIDMLERQAAANNWLFRRNPKYPLASLLLLDEGPDPFYMQFYEDLTFENFVKTQFAPPEVHIETIGLLRAVEPYTAELEVEDEGGYWDTDDRQALIEAREEFERALEAFKAAHPKAKGLIRGSDARWIDVAE